MIGARRIVKAREHMLGLLKRGGKVFTVMIPTVRTWTLLLIIGQMIQPDSIVCDSLHSYDALSASEFHHVRINHSQRFAGRQNHIDGIANFQNQTKRYLLRFNDISTESFILFLKRAALQCRRPQRVA